MVAALCILSAQITFVIQKTREIGMLKALGAKPLSFKKVLAEYRAALAANPNDEKTLCKLGEIDAGKGNISQAYAEYSKAVELEPADADCCRTESDSTR